MSCSIVHVLQGFHQPPKRTKTNTLRLAVQRISYLLLRKVTDRFGTQEDHFVWDLLRAGGRCFFEMDGARNSNSQSAALIYRCAINVCLPSHRNQVGQGENNWECINQRYQCSSHSLLFVCLVCLWGRAKSDDSIEAFLHRSASEPTVVTTFAASGWFCFHWHFSRYLGLVHVERWMQNRSS